MSDARRTLALANARVEGRLVCVRVANGYIADIADQPAPADRVLDLCGDRLLPGLINAHDHLQFNNFTPTKYRETHRNAGEWIDDVTAHRGRDARLDVASAVDFSSRAYAGGLKNLLSGVTTVCHHDDFLPELARADFPVRVLAEYGWAHSPALDTDETLRASHAGTPRDRPWIVHAGEGIDDAAAREFERLEALGCITANTLLVHGVAFDRARIERLVAAGGALIWCPASNLFLFGRTLDPSALLASGRLALGSDSRISGARDLLEELHVASQAAPGCAPELESLVTRRNASLLHITDRGALARGMRADLIVIPAGMALVNASRVDVRAVLIAGRLRYGDADIAEALARDCAPIRVDGRHKVIDRGIADRMLAMSIEEPGVQMTAVAGRAA